MRRNRTPLWRRASLFGLGRARRNAGGWAGTKRAGCCGMFGPIGSLMALGDTLVFTAYEGAHQDG